MLKKISLSMAMIFTFLAISTFNTFVLPVGAYSDASAINYISGLADYQKAATDLYMSFAINDYGDFVFPDTFAGAIIEDDTLVINLTTDDTSEYEFLTDKYTCIEFQKVKYSYNELTNIYRNYIDENGFFYHCAYVDIANNTAVIETNYENYQSAVKTRTSLPISFSIDEPIESHTTVYGGKQIVVNGDGYTIGAVGEDSNNNNCIICAGHGMVVGEKAYYNDIYVGDVTTVQYTDNGYGDYSIITLNSSIDITNESYFFSNRRITLTSGYWAAVGDIVDKYGYAGGYGYGVVKATNADVFSDANGNGSIDSGEITVRGMTLVDKEEGAYSPGDSGGPIYGGVVSDSNGDPASGQLAGIYKGASSTEFAYTPMMRVHGALPYYGEW